ncbi:hypothetical protein Sjap_012347 [Stephania japonica]|uniref:Uncharacterized protein n=1 Tax=Stephania japonica TaxID=461633 RepID=A0AAP0IX00_9MAGN
MLTQIPSQGTPFSKTQFFYQVKLICRRSYIALVDQRVCITLVDLSSAGDL